MVADAQSCDRAPAARFENVELLVGVVQRVQERTIGRRAQPRNRRLVLDGAVQGVADARFLPAGILTARGAPPPRALTRGRRFAALPSGRSLGPQALASSQSLLLYFYQRNFVDTALGDHQVSTFGRHHVADDASAG